VSRGGRNGQLWRGACAGGGEGGRRHMLCCCWCGGRKWERVEEADARAEGVGERVERGGHWTARCRRRRCMVSTRWRASTAVRRWSAGGASAKAGAGPGRLAAGPRSAARGLNRKRNHFSIYFLKNSNIFTFLSNKYPFSQVGPKIKVV
jgi:hypothetical protein